MDARLSASTRELSAGPVAPASRTLSAEVLARLREDLVSGRLVAGQRLRLGELRGIYGVGFSPLREALMMLASDGLVVGEAQRGFRAAPVSLADLADVTAMRQSIEETALRDSLANGDDTWEAGLVGAFHRLGKVGSRDPATGGVDAEWARRHHAFHLALVAGAVNQWALRLWQLLYDHSDRYRRLAAVAIPEGRLDEHRALMEAALARDAERAVALSQNHIRRTADIVAEHIERS